MSDSRSLSEAEGTAAPPVSNVHSLMQQFPNLSRRQAHDALRVRRYLHRLGYGRRSRRYGGLPTPSLQLYRSPKGKPWK